MFGVELSDITSQFFADLSFVSRKLRWCQRELLVDYYRVNILVFVMDKYVCQRLGAACIVYKWSWVILSPAEGTV